VTTISQTKANYYTNLSKTHEG